MPIRMKRIYAPVDAEDGKRVLVDRLWPRGVSKLEAKIDKWPKILHHPMSCGNGITKTWWHTGMSLKSVI